ncbi:MAG: DUF1295 domain-containing protein [Spirochaetales bacterium]|nr:DUF1295 domain-containing protein [Spirochaetales bacterium]
MNMVYLLAASLALNAFFFLFAAILKTDVFTDITYSLSFILLCALLFFWYRPSGIVAIGVLLMVSLWALRLGGYLFIRILHIKVDHRFDDRRNSFVAFGSFWLLQAISVWIIMLPVSGLVANYGDWSTVPRISLLCALGFVIGLVIETIADVQKYVYKQKATPAPQWMRTGLWSWSRHPNYFGEILVWFSIAGIGIPFYSGLQWLFFIGPLYITFLLLFVSGIPLLEKAADAKWADNPEYRAYRSATSVLIPLPPKKTQTSI